MLLTMGLLAVSCGSDDSGSDIEDIGNPSADLIVGNWSYIGDIDEDGYEASEHEPCDDEFVKFNADGTGRTTVNYCNEESEIINFSWQKTSATTYTFGDGSVSEESEVQFTQNNNRMTIGQDFEGQFYGIVYQRQ